MKNWYSTKQASKSLKISRQSMARLIGRYLEELGNEVKLTYSRGGKSGQSYTISDKGLTILANIKGESQRGGLVRMNLTNAKLNIAKKALENHNSTENNVSLSLQSMMSSIASLADLTRQNIEASNKRVENLKLEVMAEVKGEVKRLLPSTDSLKETVKEAIDPMLNNSIDSGQKRVLADLCNRIVYEEMGVKVGDDYNQFEFSARVSKLRNSMNKFVGKTSINEFMWLDYLKAYKFLKSKLKQNE